MRSLANSQTGSRRLLAVVTVAAVVAVTSLHPVDAQTSSAHVQVGAEFVGQLAADNLGTSVALSDDGNRLILGSPHTVSHSGLAGKAEVYEWSGGTWTQLGADIVGETDEDWFGSSVAMSADGSRVIVGGPHNQGSGGFDRGHARVFDWTGAAWAQLGDDIDGELDQEWAGWSVAMSADGNRVIIGFPGSFRHGYRSGFTRVFEWTGGEWSQLGADLEGASFDWFGESVDMSADGSRVIIGAANGDGNGRTEGYARIFEWVDDEWVLLTEIAGEKANDSSGQYVAMSSDGDHVVAGGGKQARVFSWTDGEWSQHGPSFGRGGLTHVDPGDATISEDGTRVSIGNRLFHWTGDTWTQIGPTFYSPFRYSGYGLTFAMSADGERMLVGEPYNSIGGSRAGRAVVFDAALPATCAGRTVTADIANGEMPSEGNDVIRGTTGPDTIDALGGDDVICGLQGDDELHGGDGSDAIYAAKGDDTIHGGDGNDLLIGGLGEDLIHGDRGNDRIQGGNDDDHMFGDGGNDIMRGGNGNDLLDGETTTI